MQRGSYIRMAVLAGALVMTGWSGHLAIAAPPEGFTPEDIGATGGSTEAQADGKVVQIGG